MTGRRRKMKKRCLKCALLAVLAIGLMAFPVYGAVGQEVEVTVDAFKGKIFRGRITAISSATGSKYSMIPTDNSAGNFVKIQQRVPVRIDLDISPEDNRKLAAGMMCVVKANL